MAQMTISMKSCIPLFKSKAILQSSMQLFTANNCGVIGCDGMWCGLMMWCGEIRCDVVGYGVLMWTKWCRRVWLVSNGQAIVNTTKFFFNFSISVHNKILCCCSHLFFAHLKILNLRF